MARVKLTRHYNNDKFFGRAGDVVELTDAELERLERDSPGTFERIDGSGTDAAGVDVTAEDVLSEQGAAILTELRDQTPSIDIDPEDKAQEIPGEGNKFTPASGYNPSPEGVRVVERAPHDRMQRSGAKRGDEADEGATSADTSANARVTDQTPASAEADAQQLAGGTTANVEEDEDDDAASTTKKSAGNKKTAAKDQDANKGEITADDFKATKKG